MNQKSQLNKIDWLVLILVIIMPLLGVVNIFSSEYNETAINIFDFESNYSKQIIWIMLVLDMIFLPVTNTILLGLIILHLKLILLTFTDGIGSLSIDNHYNLTSS